MLLSKSRMAIIYRNFVYVYFFLNCYIINSFKFSACFIIRNSWYLYNINNKYRITVVIMAFGFSLKELKQKMRNSKVFSLAILSTFLYFHLKKTHIIILIICLYK